MTKEIPIACSKSCMFHSVEEVVSKNFLKMMERKKKKKMMERSWQHTKSATVPKNEAST